MKRKFVQKYRALTLIELVIIITIIGIMSAALFVSLLSNRSASRLKVAQREVASAIKLAQTYALQGNKQNGETPCGYGLRFIDAENYEIFYNTAGALTTYADCADRNEQAVGRSWFNGNPNSSIQAEAYSLKNGVILCTGGSCGNVNSAQIYFTVPHATAYDENGNEFDSTHLPLVLTLDLSGATETVTFQPGGSVNESP